MSMCTTCTIIHVLFAHWMADFVEQKHETAINKWNNIRVLLSHIWQYSLMMLLMVFPAWLYQPDITIRGLALFTVINGLTHLIIDYFTSKASHYYFSREDWHNGFVVVGADQFCHTVILISTISLL